MEQGIANSVLRSWMQNLRMEAKQRSLSIERLPGWVTSAAIRTGWIKAETLLAVFEDNKPGSTADCFHSRGLVSVDTAILLDTRDFRPDGWTLGSEMDTQTGLVLRIGWVGEMGRTTIRLLNEKPGLFHCGYFGYHTPRGIMNMFIQLHPRDQPYALAVRFVPLALYVHACDLEDPSRLWWQCENPIMGALQTCHDTPEGDYYAALHRRFECFGIDHDNGVIVLGAYKGENEDELLQVRDEITRLGYDAHLIRDLPETPLMNLPMKVREWTLGSRFSVMVDRTPSGHLTEYEILRQQEVILALLRPRGSGSTFMIGVEPLADYNFIKVFEFDRSPLEVLESVATWAETVVARRIEAYERAYPWKAAKGHKPSPATRPYSTN